MVQQRWQRRAAGMMAVGISLAMVAGCTGHGGSRYDLTTLEREPCAELTPLAVEDLDQAAELDCDHEGRTVIFPDGTEMETRPMGHNSRSSLSETAAAYIVLNYGGAGVVAIWSQCEDGKISRTSYFGDDEVIEYDEAFLTANVTDSICVSTDVTPLEQ